MKSMVTHDAGRLPGIDKAQTPGTPMPDKLVQHRAGAAETPRLPVHEIDMDIHLAYARGGGGPLAGSPGRNAVKADRGQVRQKVIRQAVSGGHENRDEPGQPGHASAALRQFGKAHRQGPFRPVLILRLISRGVIGVGKAVLKNGSLRRPGQPFSQGRAGIAGNDGKRHRQAGHGGKGQQVVEP
ncbi:MAG: hypothetical protein FD149_1379 [Rhodospirillaceae bacterium]|nr:MAG: hypothetical protein FD149_1379 [Rhodospirillaceae bacterium]